MWYFKAGLSLIFWILESRCPNGVLCTSCSPNINGNGNGNGNIPDNEYGNVHGSGLGNGYDNGHGYSNVNLDVNCNGILMAIAMTMTFLQLLLNI